MFDKLKKIFSEMIKLLTVDSCRTGPMVKE
jgi:hypothetical protein